MSIYIEEASIRRFLETPVKFFKELSEDERISRLRINAKGGPFYLFTKRKFDNLLERFEQQEKAIKQEAEELAKEERKLYFENRKLKLEIINFNCKKNKEFGISENLTQAQEMLLKVKHQFKMFDDMSDDDVLRVLDKIVIKKFANNEYVFHQNDVGKEIFYIVQGEVDILLNDNNSQIRVASMKRGDFFGEMAFIVKVPRRSASVISTSQKTIVLSFTVKENIVAGSEQAHVILYKNIVSFLASKLNNMNFKITANKEEK